MVGKVEVLAIFIAVICAACSSNEGAWRDYALQHECVCYPSGTWKCNAPTPEWWLERK